MEFDLNALLALLTAGNAQAAAIGAVVLWFVQRLTGGKGFRPADLLADLLAALGRKSPSAPDTKPTEPKPAESPTQPRDDSDDLLDKLAERIRRRLKRKVQDAGGDDHVALDWYSRFVSALSKAEVPGRPDSK